MAKFTLSAFSDEYSPEFDKQLEGLKQNGIGYMEIRGVDEKNISSLTNEEAENAKKKLDKAGIKISSLGSPIGKISIEDDFDEHMKLLLHTLELAKIFDTKNIRMFSFFTPKDKLDFYRDEVMIRLDMMLKAAAKANITLCHENEKQIYGEKPERCLDIQNTFGGEIKCVFDPANFINCSCESYPAAFDMLKKNIYYMHIKDSNAENIMTPAGEGIGGIPEIISELNKNEKHYFLTLEPHLQVFSGLANLEHDARVEVHNQYASNEEAFNVAVKAIKNYI